MSQTDSRLKNQLRAILSDYYGTVDEDAVQALFLAVRPHKDPSAFQEMLNAVCVVFGVNVNLNASRYVRLVSDLLKEGYTPQFIREEYLPDSETRAKRGNYWDYDWRGLRGELPKEVSLRDTVARAAEGWPDLSRKIAPKRTGMLGVDV